MRIGIDARLIEETGVGRYIRNLLTHLASVDTKNEYVVFLRKKSYDPFVLPGRNWTKVLADVPWHGVREQLVMPWLFWRARADLVHVPYHNPAVLYPGRFVLTIHDLTILHVNTGRATTLPPWLYALKRLGYMMVLSLGIKRAVKIIAVSKTTKNEILDHFRVPSDKIEVIYEG